MCSKPKSPKIEIPKTVVPEEVAPMESPEDATSSDSSTATRNNRKKLRIDLATGSGSAGLAIPT